MQFDIVVWRKYYDEIHKLGKTLKESKVDDHGNPPINPLSKQEQKDLEAEIKFMSNRCNKYLDSTYMKPREPLWRYDKYDERTWLSSQHFAFSHLVKKNTRLQY
jgi:hypothetical protein